MNYEILYALLDVFLTVRHYCTTELDIVQCKKNAKNV
jgi:hypothetical protein